jgi:hypothetical protein
MDSNSGSHKERRIGELRAKADRARHHAIRVGDAMAAANLKSYAEQLEAEAAKLEAEPHTEISAQAMVVTGEPTTTQAMAALEPAKSPETTDDHA